LLASGDVAADRRARFAVVSRDAPSADAALDADNAESSSAAAAATTRDRRAANDADTVDGAKSMSSSQQLYGVRWSSCESSNGGLPRPPSGPPSAMTSTTRRGRYLAVHRYAPQNTSTGSSTSGVDVSMSSSRSELVWGGGRRSAATGGVQGVTVVSSVDADCEDNCDDVVDDSLSLYRSSSFRRAIERGGSASSPTPTVADDGATDHCITAYRFNPSGSRFSAGTVHYQPSDPTVAYRFTAGSSSRGELVNPCVSPDDTTASSRAVWDVNTDCQHVEDIDPFHCFGLSAELGYDVFH